MPVYEVQTKDGKSYEVDAPTFDQAAAAVGGNSPPAAKAPAEQPSPFLALADAYGGPPASLTPEQQSQQAQGTMGMAARAPTSFVEGAGQAATRLGNAAGVVSDERLSDYENAVRESRLEFARKNYFGKDAPKGSDLIAATAPIGGTAGAAGAAPRAGGILSGIWQWTKATAKAATVGGTMASTQYTPEEESKFGQVAWGAAFPAAAQGVVGVGAVTRNTIASWLQSGESARNASIRAAAERFFTGSARVSNPTPFTPAQATGNPVLARLEQRARGGQMQELNATQLDETRSRFDELADTAESQANIRVSPNQIARRTYTTVDALDSQMRKQRNGEFETGLADVARMGQQNNSTIALPKLSQAYKDILADDANPFNMNGSALPPNFKRASELLDKMSQQGYQPNVRNVADIMKGLAQGAARDTAVLSTADATREMYRARLWNALNDDLNGVSGIPPGSVLPAGQRVLGMNADPAFLKLQEVRSTYAHRSARLDRLQDDSINQIFGSKEVLANPRQALSKFYELPAEDQVYAVKVLGQRSPEILQAMQADRIRQALSAATKNGPASQSTFDSNTFNNVMFNGKDAAVNSRLFPQSMRATMMEGAARLQILQNHLPSGGGGSIVWPEELAINMVSQNPAFISRIVARMAYGRYGDALLGTPAGLNALRTFTSVEKPRAQASAQAAAWVLSKINEEEDSKDGK